MFEDKKRASIAYPLRHNDPAWLAQYETLLTQDLVAISELCGTYKLTEEAMDWGEWWYAELENLFGVGKYSERVTSQIQRKQTHLHKLAMVIAASQHNDLIIQGVDLETANVWLQEFESDATRALALQETTSEAQNARKLKDIILAQGRPMTKTELYRVVWETMTKDDFEESILAAFASNELIQVNDGLNLLIGVVR